jgi:hypothetical protein
MKREVLNRKSVVKSLAVALILIALMAVSLNYLPLEEKYWRHFLPSTTAHASPPVLHQGNWSTDAEVTSLSNLGIVHAVHSNGNLSDAVTISADVAHSETRSLKITSADGRTELQFYPGSIINDDFYYSWWAYIPSAMGYPDDDQWLVLFQVEGSLTEGFYPIAKLQLQPHSPTINLGWQDVSGEQHLLVQSPVVLPRDQWVHFEWYTHIGVNGEFALWMNGTQVWDVKNFDNSELNASTFYFMNDLYGMNGAYYIDDMSLFNFNMNGTAI